MKVGEKAWNYYENDMYDDNYISENDLFDDTTEIYNPVPKTIDMMNALVNQNEISLEGDKNKDSIEDFWQNNKMQNLKYKLTAWLLLTQRAVVELYKRDGEILVNLLDVDNVEVKRQGDKIIYAKITGTVNKFNKESRKFEKKETTKEYFDIKGYRKIITKKAGEKEEINPLLFDQIPIVEFTTDYNITPLFKKVDRYNEIEAFLKNVFWITGDPIAFTTNNQDEVGSENKSKMKSSKGKGLKLLHLTDGEIRFLEMQGNVAQLMLDKQKDLEDKVEKDFPEYVLAKILSKGDPSGDALKIKSLGIKSKVSSVRSDLEEGIIKMNNLALSMKGKATVEHGIGFEPMLPTNLMQLVDIIEKLKGINMLSKLSGLEKLESVSFIDNAEDEKERIEEDNSNARNRVRNELFGDEDDSQPNQ